MPEKSEKFEKEDIPKILAALREAHESKKSARVTVDFAPDGGVLTVLLDSKKRFK